MTMSRPKTLKCSVLKEVVISDLPKNTAWWQLKDFVMFNPKTWGNDRSILTVAYFSKRVAEKPPTGKKVVTD